MYVLGGLNSISSEVESVIKSKLQSSSTITRISGDDRFETSIKIAEKTTGNDKSKGAGFVKGADSKFPDALSSAALLSKKDMPLILTDGENLPKGSISYKDNSKNYIIGGEKSINISGLSGNRLSGTDRYATSASVAREGFEEN